MDEISGEIQENQRRENGNILDSLFSVLKRKPKLAPGEEVFVSQTGSQLSGQEKLDKTSKPDRPGSR